MHHAPARAVLRAVSEVAVVAGIERVVVVLLEHATAIDRAEAAPASSPQVFHFM
jgi:hypothetical protein